jgi:hypothetical protein
MFRMVAVNLWSRTVESVQRNWLTAAWASSQRFLVWPIAQLRKRFAALKSRYGPRYAYALLVVTVVAFFSPIPGTTLAGIAGVAVIAEIHRAISRARRSQMNLSKEPRVMSINCDVIVRGNATAEQLSELGSALWRWCGRAAGETGLYPCLDNQVMADLIAGKQPSSGQTPAQSEQRSDGVHFHMLDAGSHDRRGTIDRLRCELPTNGIKDVLVDGTSWNLIEPSEQLCGSS